MSFAMLAAVACGEDSATNAGAGATPTTEVPPAAEADNASAGDEPTYDGARLTINASGGTLAAGQDGTLRLDLDAATSEPQLLAPHDEVPLSGQLTHDETAQLLDLHESVEAVITVPGAPDDSNAIAATLTNLDYDAAEGLTADVTVQDATSHSVLADVSDGLDPALPTDLAAAEVHLALPKSQEESTDDVADVHFAISGKLPRGTAQHPSYYSFVNPSTKCAYDVQTINPFANQLTGPAGDQDYTELAFKADLSTGCLLSGSSGSWQVSLYQWKEVDNQRFPGGYERFGSFSVVFNPITVGVLASGCRPVRPQCNGDTLAFRKVQVTIAA